MLHIMPWCWGSKYPEPYVERLIAGVSRHLLQPFKFRPVRPEPEDEHLTRIPGCFARLRAFDPDWQVRQGMQEGDRLVCVDLDLIVTGPLDPIFDRPEPFVIFQGANSANPCPYNGSVWMLRFGAHPEVWRDFSLDAARAVPFYEFPDDQAWFAAKVPDAAGWKAGPESGVYAFKKPGWPAKGEELPAGARIVAFPGHRDPSHFTHLEWVREHWR
jgi:hypothetical protein